MASKSLKKLTLVMLTQNRRILLGMKKRGFGMGKYNGFGGKVEKYETIDEGAQRELEEEAGIRAMDLEQKGRIIFEFKDDPVLLQVNVYHCTQYEGKISESEEMKPEWFKYQDIPYDNMWKDDKFWLPWLLEGKCFEGYFLFEGHEKILRQELYQVPRLMRQRIKY